MRENRCVKCGISLNYPGVYNRTDICNFCKNFKRKSFKGSLALIERLSDAPLIGVTVSGGKDSLFVWHWAVSTFGAERVIAFNHCKVNAVDPIAIQNIKEASNILHSKVIYIVDNEFYPRFLKNLEIYIQSPNPAILRAVLCAGCRNGISNCIFKECKKYGIQKVLNGASYLELAPFKGSAMKEYGNGNETRGLLYGLAECEDYLTRENLLTIIQDHFYCHATQLSNKINEYGIDYIDFFDYFENRPSEVRKLVTSKLNWKHPENCTWHFDCIVENFKQLFYYMAYGYTELDYKFSEMVRYGLISHDVALKKLQEQTDTIIANIPTLRESLINWQMSSKTIEQFDFMCQTFMQSWDCA